MYVPEHFAMDDAAVRDLLVHHGAGDLVTTTDLGLVSTLLPFVYDPGPGPRGSLLGHFARNNEHWRLPPLGEALVILRGPDAYITPNWYASKTEHGRVVPTWNYVTAHVHGRLMIHDDPAWVEANVRALSAKHEASRAQPWSVDDAPEPYIEGQLKAIVGIELVIDRVEGKWKLSQNRSDADIAGTIDGLEASGEDRVSGAMRDLKPAQR
jgi:transcriptional regulator